MAQKDSNYLEGMATTYLEGWQLPERLDTYLEVDPWESAQNLKQRQNIVFTREEL